MAFTYDPTTEAGQVRLIIGDTDTATVANQIFTDAEIDAFLVIGASMRKGAAAALEAIAAKQAYIQKKMKVGDLTTDGPALAKELRELAASLRAQDDSAVEFDIAEWGVTDFAARDILVNSALRGG